MRRPLLPIAAALLLLPGCATPAQVAPPTAVPGMVSAADPRAAEAGAAMLRSGGSATDAALATLVALTVVEPQSSGIGGGGFLVHSDESGRVTSFDGRETAPAAATGTWFFKDGKPMGIRDAVPGGQSVGVPGNIRMMALAHRREGKLPWAQLFQPAIRLATQGFRITPRLHNALGSYRTSGALSAQARALFYGPDGNPLPVGTIVRNPQLAALLDQVARLGPDSFYVGPNGQAIVASVSTAEKNPAPMTSGDLATYSAKERPPVCGTYRDYRICGMGPPSSGGTTVFAILKQIERGAGATCRPAPPG